MQCPDCGYTGIRAEFASALQGKLWNYFSCPKCGKTGNKDTFTPKKEARE